MQRWLKFIKYLSKEHLDITVIIPDHADYASIDDSLLAEVPVKIQIKKVDVKEPSRLIKSIFGSKTKKLQRGLIEQKPGLIEKTLLWIRGNLFIPDARVGWVNRVVDNLKNDPAFAKADTLITTGPPHSVHLIGQRLKATPRFEKKQWIADFRDPWTTIGYHQSLQLTKSSEQKHRSLERQILQQADHIIVTSPSTKKEFVQKTNTPIKVITNGFDLIPNDVKQPKGDFVIRHIGTLLADRNPIKLWETLQQLCQDHEDFAADFKLELAGNLSNNIKESIQEVGITSQVNYLGYVPHDNAVELMNSAQVLLLIEINTSITRAIIPGKTFEYIASRRPVVAIGPQDSDIECLLQESNAGVYFTYEVTGLYDHILDLYRKYKQELLLGNDHAIDRYHRKSLTKELEKVISL